MEETSLLGAKRKNPRFRDMEESISLVIQLLLWCSAWGFIDCVVGEYTKGDSIQAAQLYSVILVGGSLAYMLSIRNKERVSLLHPGVFEFLSLVVTCVGSWGLINSVVSVIAKVRGVSESAVHGGLFILAGLFAVWHHTFIKPNFIIDKLLD